jgi:cytochrome c oxidase subunit II
MAITSPERRLWWNEKLHKPEIIWISVSFVWGLIMFFAMIYWHIFGQQNLSNEAYRVDPAAFAAKAEAMTARYTVREEGELGLPVVHPPAGGDVYMIARLWEWWPILELEKNQSYRLHLSSMDYQHGFSLQPANINIQVHPNYDLVLTVTPNETGIYSVVCNEYCGVGHHAMVGRIHVVDKK